MRGVRQFADPMQLSARLSSLDQEAAPDLGERTHALEARLCNINHFVHRWQILFVEIISSAFGVVLGSVLCIHVLKCKNKKN